MSSSPSSRTARPRPRPALLAALLHVLVLVAVLTALVRGSRGVSATGNAAAPELPVLQALQSAQERSQGGAPAGRRAAVGTADGVVPDGVTVFDDRYPAIADLAPSLLVA